MEYEQRHLLRAASETASAAGLNRDSVVHHVTGDEPVDLVRVAPRTTRTGPTSHYQRTTTPSEHFTLVPAGEAVEGEVERVGLTDLVTTRAGDLAATERVTNAGRMDAATQKAVQEEREALAEEAGRRVLEATDPAQLADISVQAVEYMGLPADSLEIIHQAVTAGDAGERARQEVYLLRRFVEGPTGDIEPAYSLHRWTPDAPRPARGSFGPGSDTFSVSELLGWVRDRAEIQAIHGVDAATAHGFGAHAFRDRGLERAKEL